MYQTEMFWESLSLNKVDLSNDIEFIVEKGVIIILPSVK